jgi:hypothetical protein
MGGKEVQREKLVPIRAMVTMMTGAAQGAAI